MPLARVDEYASPFSLVPSRASSLCPRDVISGAVNPGTSVPMIYIVKWHLIKYTCCKQRRATSSINDQYIPCCPAKPICLVYVTLLRKCNDFRSSITHTLAFGPHHTTWHSERMRLISSAFSDTYPITFWSIFRISKQQQFTLPIRTEYKHWKYHPYVYGVFLRWNELNKKIRITSS